MPVLPTYPGVYIEEVPSGVRTITGVATSIATFLGRATKGPINKATRILSLADFERVFGAPHPNSDLGYSIRHFFNNGGTDCYTVRLANGAVASAITLHALFDVTPENSGVLRAEAKAEGVWANTLRLEVNYNTASPDDTFNLNVFLEEGGQVIESESLVGLSMNPASPRFAPEFVTQNSQLITLTTNHSSTALGNPRDPAAAINDLANSFAGFSESRRPLDSAIGTAVAEMNGLLATQSRFEISLNDGPWLEVDLSVGGNFPGTLGAWENELEARIEAVLQQQDPGHDIAVSIANVTNLGRFIRLTSNSGNQSSVRIRRASSRDITAPLMWGVDQGGVELTRYSNFRPAPTATILALGPTAGALDVLNAIARLTQEAFNRITIDGNDIDLVGDFSLMTTGADNPWAQADPAFNPASFTEDPPGTFVFHDGTREKLRILARAINAAGNLDYRAEVWGHHLAIIATGGTISQQPEVAVNPATSGFTDGLRPNIRQYSLGVVRGGFSTNAVFGQDGGPPQEADYLGSESNQTGLHALDAVDLFNLMIIPGDEGVADSVLHNLWGPASTYCQSRRAFLLIDPPLGWTDPNRARPSVVGDTALINDLRATVVKDHAAVFYPRLRYSRDGRVRSIGPAGAIAGLMARIDASRGVWKAPAGLEAGLRGILDLEVRLSDPENGVLNKKGVNAIRSFPAGTVNWGARTLAGDDDVPSEWKYIPVRRLALFLEESLYRGTQWAVFEPNDEPLWAELRLNIGAFMQNLFRQGAFQGRTPQEAFFVKCDKETTPQNHINLGIVNILVGFAPLKPAEFVIIQIQQMAGRLQT